LDWRSEETSVGSRFVSASASNTMTSTDFAHVMTAGLQGSSDIVDVLTNLGVTVSNPTAIRKGDLAEKLFIGLEAGYSRPGQGDWRCVYDHLGGTAPQDGVVGTLPPYSRSSSMSWLRIDNSNGSQGMNLRYKSANVKDAARELARLYYNCRMNIGTNPCFANEDDESARGSNQNFNLNVTSDPSNPLGKGQTLNYGPAYNALTDTYDGRNLQVSVGNTKDTWTFQLTPPRGQNWVAGQVYNTAGGARDNLAELNVYRNGVQCSRPVGTMRMNAIAFSGTTLTALNVDFGKGNTYTDGTPFSGVTCSGAAGALGGQLRFLG
jgi:hypothetical protein